MTLKKRGLGRGLEALLAEEEKHQPKTGQAGAYPAAKDADQDEMQSAGEAGGQTAMLVAFFKDIQREHLTLLAEAEALRKLMEEFEAIVRADLS
ncbi:MAG: hypothetical protein K9L79_16090 [Methylobacter tundripaludum]|nr:hypothetical protein [Methylobacter tundripaludum]